MNRKFFSLKDTLFLIFLFIIPFSVFIISNYSEKTLVFMGKYYLALLLIALFAFLFNFLKTIYNYIFVSIESKKNNTHADTAIILGNNDIFCLKHWLASSYSYKFKTFFKYLKLKKVNYNVYNHLNKQRFNRIINNRRIRNIYLFGHGNRHAFGLFEDVPIYYCNYRNKGIEKDFIAQYHCNHGFGGSLADYVVIDKNKLKCCDITKEEWSQCDINRFIKQKYKEELKKIKQKRNK